MNRRTFLSLVATLPLLGRLVLRRPDPVMCVDQLDCRLNIMVLDHGELRCAFLTVEQARARYALGEWWVLQIECPD